MQKGEMPLSGISPFNMVEAVGIEPTSEDRPDRASTCLVDAYFHRAATPPTEKAARPAGRDLALRVPAPRKASLFFRRPVQAPQAGIMQRTWLPLIRQPEPIHCWQLLVFPFGNGVRVPGMRPDPTIYPRRNRVAPLSKLLIQVIFCS